MGTARVWGVWGEHPGDGHGVGRAPLGCAKPRFGECGVIVSGMCSVLEWGVWGDDPWDVLSPDMGSVGDHFWDMLSLG